MHTLAMIIGIIGGLSAVTGIISATEVSSELSTWNGLTWIFWFALSIILFLAAIALHVHRGDGE